MVHIFIFAANMPCKFAMTMLICSYDTSSQGIIACIAVPLVKVACHGSHRITADRENHASWTSCLKKKRMHPFTFPLTIRMKGSVLPLIRSAGWTTAAGSSFLTRSRNNRACSMRLRSWWTGAKGVGFCC